MKLFIVNTNVTPSGAFSTGTDYSQFYVVAENADKAYQIVRDYLDEKDLCFKDERSMKSVELIAETGDYPECRKILFLQPLIVGDIKALPEFYVTCETPKPVVTNEDK